MGKALRGRPAVCILLAVLVFAAFAPTLENGFVGYDDPDYVTANPQVNRGLNLPGIGWAFTATHANNWHPLTWLSHALDCSLFGLNPRGHHATSLLLHIANTLLLFLWLSGATGSIGRSAFAAAIFGVHPAHVESVAWIAERKDVLSVLFGLSTLIAYTQYARKPALGRYCVVSMSFAASLASKQTLVTLPLVLLALDFWPLRRKERPARLVTEKIPLFLLAGLASFAAFWAQRFGGALVNSGQLPASVRLENGAVSLVRYLGETVWPMKLAAFYPYPAAGIPAWTVAASAIAIAAATAAALILRRGHPWLTVGWVWYLLTLLPVIGIVQVGMQARADRYLYLSMVGLLIATAWEFKRAKAARVAAAAAVCVCAVLTWRQVDVWKDGSTLFRHAIAVTDGNYVAHDNLGVELDRDGRSDEALSEYREAVRIRPGDRHAEYNYSQAVFAKGEQALRENRFADAATLFEDGLRHQPDNAAALTDLGAVRVMLGDLQAGIACFDRALRIDPGYGPARAARAELVRQIQLAHPNSVK